ncbi:MAG: EamA family transporter, partial [Oscillospiraceae bacterium]
GRQKLIATLCILVGASLWGTTGLFNRYLMAGGLSPYSITVIRNFGGLVLLALIFALHDRHVFHVKPAHLKYFLGTGTISVLLFALCYFSCQEICSLAVASILLYTAPAMVVIFSAILWKEPITQRKIAALLLTLLGCACVTGIFGGSLTVTVTGILLGLASALFYALYSIFGRYALAHYDSMTVTVWTFVFAGFGSLLFIRPAEFRAAFVQPSMLLFSLGLVVFSTVVPYLLYTTGLAKVESGKACIMASMEPVVASLIGALVFGEPMTFLTLAGIGCVLAGVWILK